MPFSETSETKITFTGTANAKDVKIWLGRVPDHAELSVKYEPGVVHDGVQNTIQATWTTAYDGDGASDN